MSELLYLHDSYPREFDAVVTAHSGTAVMLTRTAFYPGGAGNRRMAAGWGGTVESVGSGRCARTASSAGITWTVLSRWSARQFEGCWTGTVDMRSCVITPLSMSSSALSTICSTRSSQAVRFTLSGHEWTSPWRI